MKKNVLLDLASLSFIAETLNRFYVMKTGQLDSIRVIKGTEPLLDAEALRVIRLMPH